MLAKSVKNKVSYSLKCLSASEEELEINLSSDTDEDMAKLLVALQPNQFSWIFSRRNCYSTRNKLSHWMKQERLKFSEKTFACKMVVYKLKPTFTYYYSLSFVSSDKCLLLFAASLYHTPAFLVNVLFSLK